MTKRGSGENTKFNPGIYDEFKYNLFWIFIGNFFVHAEGVKLNSVGIQLCVLAIIYSLP